MSSIVLLLILYCSHLISSQQNTFQATCYDENGFPARCEPPRQSFSFAKQPTTNSTCGSPPTTFCYRQIIRGVVGSDCTGLCNASDQSNSHPPELMTDFLLNEESWWQSDNSRNTENVVLIDLPLNAMVEISVIAFNFLSFKPRAFYLQKSNDYGQTYSDFHYFATSCTEEFEIDPDQILSLENETTTLCQPIVSAPLPGQISFFPALGRPSTNDSTAGLSNDLYDFITATNIRVILLAHLAIPDLPEDDFGYYYAIEDFNVVGSCQCNGHAASCFINVLTGNYMCDCQHNTTGNFCEACRDFYQDVPWQRADGSNSFECIACNCNGHTEECIFSLQIYEESGGMSGGVCQHCLHNTAGRWCERCAEFYFPSRDLPQDDPGVCVACDCNLSGVSNNGDCAKQDGANGIQLGDCSCKINVQGRACDQCRLGFFNLSSYNDEGCEVCGCNITGSSSSNCDQQTGVCSCKPNVMGDKCDLCRPGYFLANPASAEGCLPCNCNIGGSVSENCDMHSGQCICRNGVTGSTCSDVITNNFFPNIDYLILEAEYAEDEIPFIPPTNGNEFFTGSGYIRIADESSIINFGIITPPITGLYEVLFRYNLDGILIWDGATLTIQTDFTSELEPVNCGNVSELSENTNINYSSWRMGLGITISQTFCFRGGQPYTFVLSNFSSNQETALLDIDSLVLIPSFIYDLPVFLDIQIARDYNACVAEFRSLVSQPAASPSCELTIFTVSTAIYNGTLECSCDAVGALPNVSCEPFGGRCSCHNGVIGTQCSNCAPGFHTISEDGCTSCSCNINGSRSIFCDPDSGDCECLENVVGQNCSVCASNYWGLMVEGCTECNCDSIGSETSQCDQFTGECQCKSGVEGESCDRCSPLFYGFSSTGCRSCSCTPAGSRNMSCDIFTGQCMCQSNVQDRNCSQCIEGTFNLQDSNPDGCQPCFCSGQSSSCTTPDDPSSTSVEQCTCPSNYSGLSCEFCAPGYTRTPIGTCEFCECNGFSTDCDPETGLCHNCTMLTTGNSCELCSQGSFGDPMNGIGCQLCPCPLTSALGQFSNDCILDVTEDVICTNCRAGHTGTNCESCISGFFGDPTGSITGTPSMCSDCECNDNIDADDPLSCDRITGVCLLCLNNTAGNQCEICADQFYGDAITSKNCTACNCDLFGSSSSVCDKSTGQCPCYSNIIGRQCSSCAPDHYMISTAIEAGCQPCNCNLQGSISSQCDNSGECSCKSGVSGRTCNQCQQGYFGFSSTGCSECACSVLNSESASCDSTGRCLCQRGSTGVNCEQCLPNFFQVDTGCTMCPTCYQELQIITENNANLSSDEMIRINALFGISSLPFDPRLLLKQSEVLNISVDSQNLLQIQMRLMIEYHNALSLLNQTLNTDLIQITFSLDALKRSSTPVFVLASTSEELMNRTTEEFYSANALLESIRLEVLPIIEHSATLIETNFLQSNITAQAIFTNMNTILTQVEVVNQHILSLLSLSMSSVIIAERLQPMHSMLQITVESIEMSSSMLDTYILSLMRDLSSLSGEVMDIIQAIVIIENSITTVPSATLITSLESQTETYITNDIVNLLQTQWMQFNELNTLLTNEQMVLDKNWRKLSEIQQDMVFGITSACKGSFDRAEEAASESSAFISQAELLHINLLRYAEESSELVRDSTAAFTAVDQIELTTAMTLMASQNILVSLGLSINNILLARETAVNSNNSLSMASKGISLVDTSTSVVSVNEHLSTALNSFNTISNSTVPVESSLVELEEQSIMVEQSRVLVNQTNDIKTGLQSLNVQANLSVTLLQDSLSTLNKVDSQKIELISQLIRDVGENIGFSGLHQLLTDRIANQMYVRQQLEIELSMMQRDIQYLRDLNATMSYDC